VPAESRHACKDVSLYLSIWASVAGYFWQRQLLRNESDTSPPEFTLGNF